MESTPIDNYLDRQAVLSISADVITAAHAASGLAVAAWIHNHNEPSMTEFMLFAGPSLGDVADGRLKRDAMTQAMSVLSPDQYGDLRYPEGISFMQQLKTALLRPAADAGVLDTKGLTTEQRTLLKKYSVVEHPNFDHNADKVNFYLVLGALIERANRSGHNKTLAALVLNMTVSIGRDVARDIQRKEAALHNLPTNATDLGKQKTKFQKYGLGVLTSPLARVGIGRAIGVGLLSYGTSVGLVDLKKNQRYLKDARYRRMHGGKD